MDNPKLFVTLRNILIVFIIFTLILTFIMTWITYTNYNTHLRGNVAGNYNN